MKVRYDPAFIRSVKKLDVIIRKNLKEKLALFIIDPFNPQLDNHALRKEYKGFRSIDISSDFRALYREVLEGEELVAFFIVIGTHKQLYRK